jgi:hypothetical protein
VIHCDATLWRTIELGVLDASSDSDCCVDCCIGDGVVGKSGDGCGRGQPEAKTKIKKGSVDWRDSFVNYTFSRTLSSPALRQEGSIPLT